MSRNAPSDLTIQEARNRLAARMTELRQATNLSQDEAAARAGFDRRTWVRYEGGRHNPRLDSLLRIQYALGVDSLEALFGETTGDLFGRDSLTE